MVSSIANPLLWAMTREPRTSPDSPELKSNQINGTEGEERLRLLLQKAESGITLGLDQHETDFTLETNFLAKRLLKSAVDLRAEAQDVASPLANWAQSRHQA